MSTRYKIAVIGLGIIGGSVAYALKGFKNAEIAGCDIDEETRKSALKKEAVSSVFETPGDAIQGADLVVFALSPELVAPIIKENQAAFKENAVITDVCGIKTTVSREVLKVLPKSCFYVGGHPMAGKETGGFINASPELFWMCGYIITPTKRSSDESIKLVVDMARYMGATRITLQSPETHDKIIAYTSDLMHISASALCLSFPSDMNRAYTAGAFRDCTRIANIDPRLWAELFLENKDNVINETDRLIGNLEKIKSAIENSDKQELEKLLQTVRENKIMMQNKEP